MVFVNLKEIWGVFARALKKVTVIVILFVRANFEGVQIGRDSSSVEARDGLQGCACKQETRSWKKS